MSWGEYMVKEMFDTCSWCNKKDTIITCAGCGKPVKYGESQASEKIKISGQGLRICKECKENE